MHRPARRPRALPRRRLSGLEVARLTGSAVHSVRRAGAAASPTSALARLPSPQEPPPPRPPPYPPPSPPPPRPPPPRPPAMRRRRTRRHRRRRPPAAAEAHAAVRRRRTRRHRRLLARRRPARRRHRRRGLKLLRCHLAPQVPGWVGSRTTCRTRITTARAQPPRALEAQRVRRLCAMLRRRPF